MSHPAPGALARARVRVGAVPTLQDLAREVCGLDHEALEGAACECYGIVRQQFEQMLGAAT